MKKVLALTALLSSAYVGAMEFQQQEDFNKERVGVMTPFGGRVRSLSKDNISYPVKNIDEVKDAVKSGDKVKYNLTKDGDDITAVVSDVVAEEGRVDTSKVARTKSINTLRIQDEQRFNSSFGLDAGRSLLEELYPDVNFDGFSSSAFSYNNQGVNVQYSSIGNDACILMTIILAGNPSEAAQQGVQTYLRSHPGVFGSGIDAQRQTIRNFGYAAGDVIPTQTQDAGRGLKKFGKKLGF